MKFPVLILLVFALVASISPALAQSRFALIIGNGQYDQVANLTNPKNDAALIALSLSAVGFETETLIDLDEDAMGQALDRLAARANDYDEVVVYYAGHGVQSDGKNYLVPTDANLVSSGAIAHQTISVDAVMDVLSQFQTSILFLDACRNNPWKDVLAQTNNSTDRAVSNSRGLAVVRPRGDMMIAFATLPNAVALDGEGDNSPFATALSHHIKTPDVEISVLMKRITADVLTQTNGAQRPQQLSQMQSEFYFTQTTTQTSQTPVFRSMLSVYPLAATTGQEIALVSDIPLSCNPSFFDLSASGKVTPIPQQFFRQVVLGNGQNRFEISPGSKFGLIIQEGDERGAHSIGFFCSKPDLGQDETASLLTQLKLSFDQGNFEGQVDDIDFHFQSYTIN